MKFDYTRNPWTLISEEVKYENPWIKLTEHKVLNPKGGDGIYGVVHFKHLAIGIVAMENENLWLVGQYRFPLNQYSWEIPEGGGKHGVSPLESAKRELLEEVGAEADYWEEIGRSHLSNSVSDELAILYLAKGLKYTTAEPEDTEELRVRQVSLLEAYEMVKQGEITDSMSIQAIQTLYIRKLEGHL